MQEDWQMSLMTLLQCTLSLSVLARELRYFHLDGFPPNQSRSLINALGVIDVQIPSLRRRGENEAQQSVQLPRLKTQCRPVLHLGCPMTASRRR